MKLKSIKKEDKVIEEPLESDEVEFSEDVFDGLHSMTEE